jgi:hypothetical protein
MLFSAALATKPQSRLTTKPDNKTRQQNPSAVPESSQAQPGFQSNYHAVRETIAALMGKSRWNLDPPPPGLKALKCMYRSVLAGLKTRAPGLKVRGYTTARRIDIEKGQGLKAQVVVGPQHADTEGRTDVCYPRSRDTKRVVQRLDNLPFQRAVFTSRARQPDGLSCPTAASRTPLWLLSG